MTADVAGPAGETARQILLVDDEEGVRMAGQVLLQRLGHEVAVAWDGSEALQLLRDSPERFDLVITDQSMPGQTGIGLAEEIRKLRHDLPVVLASGLLDETSERALREGRIAAVLLKPFGLSDLRTVLDRVFPVT